MLHLRLKLGQRFGGPKVALRIKGPVISSARDAAKHAEVFIRLESATNAEAQLADLDGSFEEHDAPGEHLARKCHSCTRA